MKIVRLTLPGLLAVSTLTLGSMSASAATNGFFTPFFRGSANSEAGYWEFFAWPRGTNNAADRPGSTTGALLLQSDLNAFRTSTSNIYNPSALLLFTLADETPFTLGTVVLQTHTAIGGNELNYGSMSLSYVDGSGSHTVSPLADWDLNRANGVSHFWQWNLTGLGVTSYEIQFQTAAPNASFDALTLDTWNQFAPVPEPSMLGLASIGFAALAVTRRKRKTGSPTSSVK